MKITDFEEYIEDIILERGWNYYVGEHVGKISKVEDRYFVIEVIGSEDYTVEIELKGDGTVIRSSCNCPYDWGDYCKHETAALFALREKYESEHDVPYKGESSFQKKLKLEEILPNLSRDELIQIILSMTSEHEQIKKKLLFQLAPKKDEIAVSKKLIRDYINRAKHRGFIKWNKVSDALYGVDLTLTKASERIENKEEEIAVYLGLTVLPVVVDMLEYSDDSSGSVGFRINESLDLIKEAVFCGIPTFDEEIKRNH